MDQWTYVYIWYIETVLIAYWSCRKSLFASVSSCLLSKSLEYWGMPKVVSRWVAWQRPSKPWRPRQWIIAYSFWAFSAMDSCLQKHFTNKGKGAKGTTIQLNHLHVSFEIWVSLVSLDRFPSSCWFIDGLEQLEGEQTSPVVCPCIFLRKRLRFAMVLRKTMLHTPASTLVLDVWAFAPMSHDAVGQTVVGVDHVIVISLGVTWWSTSLEMLDGLIADGFNLQFHMLIQDSKYQSSMFPSISSTLHVSPISLGCVGFTLAPWINENSLWDVFWECSACWNSLANTQLKQNAVRSFLFVCSCCFILPFCFLNNAGPQWPHSTANRGVTSSAGQLTSALLRHQWIHGARRLQGGELLPRKHLANPWGKLKTIAPFGWQQIWLRIRKTYILQHAMISLWY